MSLQKHKNFNPFSVPKKVHKNRGNQTPSFLYHLKQLIWEKRYETSTLENGSA